MYTTLAFVTKKPGTSTKEFISHYENIHVPLIISLTGPDNQPLVYKRRYPEQPDTSDAVDGNGQPIPTEYQRKVDFDVVTELGFEDEAAQRRWMEALMKDNKWEIVNKDEEQFQWREKTRIVHVSEFGA